ncbi:MAG: aminopeptidase P family protein [Lachnospiraceae bacterium]|nr:aminopeptidase P family protein [Lachnospiraceae bacterium]
MAQAEQIRSRLEQLRAKVREQKAQWYLMVTMDPHASEYINDHYKEREYFSGFTGSNGTLLVGPEEACLWTDGRYFVQAEKELRGSGITLMRMGDAGVPKLTEYLKSQVAAGDVLLADGRLVSARQGREIYQTLREVGASFKVGKNLTEGIWKERPADSEAELRLLPKKLYGQEYHDKMMELRDEMEHRGAAAFVLSKLDDQMWLFNLRGNDIAYNPVAYAYTVVTGYEVFLYVKEAAVTDALCNMAMDEDITLKRYEDFYTDLTKFGFADPVLVDLENTNYLTCRLLERSGCRLIDTPNPTEEWKAVKNETEIARLKQAYLEDSAVLTKFLFYMKENAGKIQMSEVDAQKKLDAMRAKLPSFRDLSFTTISAFGSNAAMMHYEATEEDCAQIGTDGFYLVDSGAQYDGGTTDVTRTLAIGRISEEHKKHFTRVAAGMLALQNAVFLQGCTGRNLDILARGPVWEMDMDYKCGTGHGVGYMLNVHEGPQGIRWKQPNGRKEGELRPGMLVSDEPGVYVAGSHGIRLENILLVTKKCVNSDGEFLTFAPLTWVPLDLDGVDAAYLEPKEKTWLNSYHQQVCEKLMPFMETEEEKSALFAATRQI